MRGGWRGGGGDIQICTYWTWKWVSYRSRRAVLMTLHLESKTAVECLNGWSSALFGSWDPPTLRPPHIHLTSFAWWMLPGLPRSSPAICYCECKWGACERDYSSFTHSFLFSFSSKMLKFLGWSVYLRGRLWMFWSINKASWAIFLASWISPRSW